MQNELFIKEFISTGSLPTLLEWIRYLKSNEYYHIVILVGELVYPLFSYSIEFLDELGMCYYYCMHYQQSWDVYMDILASATLSENRQKAYFFNAHFSIPHIMKNPKLIEYPDTRVINQIVFNTQPMPLITFSITTCKRYDLFEKTMNSFINCCQDIDLITRWICVDDNSSEEDRIKMKKKYPFFDFVWKSPEQKGHAQSMNIILNKVDTPYLFHMEDDWQFFNPAFYIRQCLEVLSNNPNYGQCLINKNYAETFEDVRIIGGIFKTTKDGLRYYVHDHEPDGTKFQERYGHGANCAYWAHYSLRPGLNRTNILKDVGAYDPSVSHFEMDFAYRYMNKGYRTTFLDMISCTHIGRLTSERGDDTKINAYKLNDELQFVSKDTAVKQPEEVREEVREDTKIDCHCIVINMDNRPDRLKLFEDEINKRKEEDGQFLNVTKFSAVDGYNLKSTRQLEQLFNPNDYNYRKGMIGCALSHITLWTKLAYQKGIFIILEDDVTFVPYFVLKLKNVFDQLNGKNWDIIFLGHHLYNKYKTDDSYHKHKMPTIEQWNSTKSLTESIGGTGGYVINNVGAMNILKFIQQNGMTNGIDTMMQKACDSLHVYYCNPHLIYSECYSVENMEDVDTDIQRNYDSLKRPLQERIEDEFRFFQKNQVPVIKCTSNNVCSYSPVDHVIICFNNCTHPRDVTDIYYTIENVQIYIPAQVLSTDPEVANVGLIVDGKLSVEKIIQYNES
jgi:GR25 family glycosyltransferase involved in LPS biosynthesis